MIISVFLTCIQMVTLRDDPARNPKKWVQATEFIPVGMCILYMDVGLNLEPSLSRVRVSMVLLPLRLLRTHPQ